MSEDLRPTGGYIPLRERFVKGEKFMLNELAPSQYRGLLVTIHDEPKQYGGEDELVCQVEIMIHPGRVIEVDLSWLT